MLAFGFNGLGLVSYKRELEGKSEFFHDAAGLSKAVGGVVISGCDTDTYGIFRHSALIADRGRILGVSDMSFSLDESEFRAGGNFRVYETGAGRIGLLVGDDIYFTEAAKVLSLCDADFIVCVYHQVLSNMTEIMLRRAHRARRVGIRQRGGYRRRYRVFFAAGRQRNGDPPGQGLS